MARDLTFESFLKELGMRVGAAAVVVGVFFALGYLNRTNPFGIFNFLSNQLAFVLVVFVLIAVVSVGWITLQRYRS